MGIICVEARDFEVSAEAQGNSETAWDTVLLRRRAGDTPREKMLWGMAGGPWRHEKASRA